MQIEIVLKNRWMETYNFFPTLSTVVRKMATAKKQQASFIAIMSGLHIHSYCKILKLFLVVIGIERLGFNRPSK